MGEIRRAVQRVNDPEVRRLAFIGMSALFCEKAMGGKTRSQVVNNTLFDRTVCVRDQIDEALVFNMKTLVRVFLKDRSCFFACSNGGLEAICDWNFDACH